MHIVIDRRTAGVELYLTSFERREGLLLFGEGIVELHERKSHESRM